MIVYIAFYLIFLFTEMRDYLITFLNCGPAQRNVSINVGNILYPFTIILGSTKNKNLNYFVILFNNILVL